MKFIQHHKTKITNPAKKNAPNNKTPVKLQALGVGAGFNTSVNESMVVKIELREKGKQVARGFLYLIKNQLHKHPYGLMEDIFVSEQLRGKGIGSALIGEIIKEAKKRKCYKLIATSRFSKPQVHKLYKKFGFVRHGVEFRVDFT